MPACPDVNRMHDLHTRRHHRACDGFKAAGARFCLRLVLPKVPIRTRA
jgi:hypothetical protein